MNTELKNSLIAHFSKQIERSVRVQFDNIITHSGPTAKGVANSRLYRVWSETVRPCCDRSSTRMDATYSLNEERLARFVAVVSEEFAAEVLAKVDAKVGELTNGKATLISGANFNVVGQKNGHNISIEQNQIINVSVKGKLFNQFPARIYVDGKFTPASKFAKI